MIVTENLEGIYEIEQPNESINSQPAEIVVNEKIKYSIEWISHGNFYPSNYEGSENLATRKALKLDVKSNLVANIISNLDSPLSVAYKSFNSSSPDTFKVGSPCHKLDYLRKKHSFWEKTEG